ncbi:hypothetical protein BMS84_09860 [Leuconostoc pseudomesenteroides]|nr:hypothetical protein BMS84_09860 [Leuconostoc pseudomesenteroides]
MKKSMMIQSKLARSTLSQIKNGKNKEGRINMEELIKLIVGLIKGQFELKEYTRLNEEVDDDTVEVSFRFDVIQKFPLRK